MLRYVALRQGWGTSRDVLGVELHLPALARGSRLLTPKVRVPTRWADLAPECSARGQLIEPLRGRAVSGGVAGYDLGLVLVL
jgi:hypothetical protein